MKLIKTALFLLLIAAIITGCKKDNTTEPPAGGTPPKVDYGTVIQVASEGVSPAGSVIKIHKPGTPVNGLEIDFPANAFTTSKTVQVSYAELKNHQFGTDFHPITPIIRIDYGGGYADSVMTLHLPCTVPAGHFAMGFYYDASSGELEGIPLVAINDSEIVLATRHFSGNHLSDGTGLAKSTLNNIFNKEAAGHTYVDIIAASIESAKLFGVQESGFRPGVDDWEFPNYGSYIAPNGHCTGQSMTAMWYYSTQKLKQNEPSLFNRFKQSSTNLWQDNPYGYRFASTVQKDQVTKTRQAWLDNFINIGTKRFSRDSLNYLAFAYAIHMTDKPQLVEIWNNNGGHAMIIYRANSGALSVADPNFPGSYQHLITLGSDGKFIPYESKQRANDPSVTYPVINYVSKSSLFSFAKVSQRYTELKNKIIGNDYFPAFSLKIKNDGDKDLVDQMSTKLDTLKLYALSPGGRIGSWTMDGTDYLWTQVFNENGNIISLLADEFKGIPVIPLKPGSNKIGIYMRAGVLVKNDWFYTDFKWLTIIRDTSGAPVITLLNPAQGKIGDTVIIIGFKFGTDKTKGTVAFNLIKALSTDIISWTDTKILVKVPSGASSGPVVATVNGIASNSNKLFAVISGCNGVSTVSYSGQIYNTVAIGNQCWLKENLNGGTMIDSNKNASNNNTIEKYCFHNDEANCATYGGLYQWDEAMQYSRTEKAQGICPPGWHIPGLFEFADLQVYVNGTNTNGNAFKAIGQGSGAGAGTNTSGFSALLTGWFWSPDTVFNANGSSTAFWTSTEAGYDLGAWVTLGLDGSNSSTWESGPWKKNGYPVRCLKN